jgi:hypothetical protein
LFSISLTRRIVLRNLVQYSSVFHIATHWLSKMCPTVAALCLLAAISSVVFAIPTPEQGNVGKFSLAFAATVNLTGWANIAEADRARAAALYSNALARQNGKRSEVPVVNNAVTYTASVGIGSDNTQCKQALFRQGLRSVLIIPNHRYSLDRHRKLEYVGWGTQTVPSQ